MADVQSWLRRQVREVLVIDPRALALMRMGLAIVVLVDLAMRAPDVRDLYSDAGILPRATTGVPDFWGFRLYLLSGDDRWVLFLMGVTALLATALLLGWFSRTVTVLLWLLVGSLQLRNTLVLQGGDDLLHNFLLWSMFLPTGARWSLDARRRPSISSAPLVGIPSVALYLQLFLLYFVTGTMKASNPHWWWGDGVYHALSADYLVTPLGRWLYPHWYLLKLLTWLTLTLEIAVPFVLLAAPRSPRLRLALTTTFVLFHVGIASTLHVGLFSWVCMVCWLFTLPRETMDRVESWLRRLGVSKSDPDAERPAESRIGSWSVAALLVMVLVSGAAVDKMSDSPLRRALTYPTRTLHLQVRWGLFVGPRDDSGWYVLHARRADGHDVDLMRGGADLSWERPDSIVWQFPNQRWRKFFSRLDTKSMKGRLDAYLQWLCRSQPAETPGTRLVWVELVYVKHMVGPRYDHGPETRDAVGKVSCQPPG